MSVSEIVNLSITATPILTAAVIAFFMMKANKMKALAEGSKIQAETEVIKKGDPREINLLLSDQLERERAHSVSLEERIEKRDDRIDELESHESELRTERNFYANMLDAFEGYLLMWRDVCVPDTPHSPPRAPKRLADYLAREERHAIPPPKESEDE